MLEAGRELDALVAEKVMGWASVHPGDEYDPRTPGSLVYVGITPDQRQLAILPPYTTDIGAAWQVIETLAARGVSLDMQYRVFTAEWELNVGGALGYGETAPLAICRAALEAVGAIQSADESDEASVHDQA